MSRKTKKSGSFQPLTMDVSSLEFLQSGSNHKSEGRLLAVDYGTKRCGIAVTDPFKIIVTALTTIDTTTLQEYIKKYCSQENVEAFVVGLPLYPDGNPTALGTLVDAFVEELQKNFPDKKVFRQDERYTSRDAQQIILQSGAKKQKRQDKSLVDKIAAALILEQYMYENYWK